MCMLSNLYKSIQNLLAPALPSTSPTEIPKFTLAKYRLASSPDTPSDILAKLARSSSPKIATRAAENSKTDSDVLVDLAHHQEPAVRIAVAQNANTPDHILHSLAQDEHLDVRYNLAENHNVSPTLLYKLLQDENPYVALRAQQTLERLASMGLINNQAQREPLKKANM